MYEPPALRIFTLSGAISKPVTRKRSPLKSKASAGRHNHPDDANAGLSGLHLATQFVQRLGEEVTMVFMVMLGAGDCRIEASCSRRSGYEGLHRHRPVRQLFEIRCRRRR